MGRGDRQTSASRSAQSLLFGPRMGRKITPEGKKKRTVEKRKMTMQSRQRGHARNIAKAGDDLLNGNPQPLIALMEAEAPKGSMGAEKQALKDLTQTLLASGAARSPSQVKSDSEPLPGGEETINALQLLRQRCEARKCPKRAVSEPLRGLVGAQAYIHVYQNTIEELKKNADDIGTLPQTCKAIAGWAHHLLGADGKTTCGQEVDQSEVKDSILSCRNLYCRDCHEKNTKDATAQVSPEKWLEEIDSKNASIITYPYRWREPDSDISSQNLLKEGKSKALTNLADSFSDYGIEAPKSWI